MTGDPSAAATSLAVEPSVFALRALLGVAVALAGCLAAYALA